MSRAYTASFCYFPEEVLELVFRFLDIRSRLTARLVCKQWLRIMDSPTLLDEACMTIHSDFFKLKEIMAWGHNFTNFSLENIVIDMANIEFFNSRREHLYSLTFIECPINEYVYLCNAQPINECRKLKELTIRDCDAWRLFSSLPNLEKLVIESKRDFSDRALCDLKKSILNLKSLSLNMYVGKYKAAKRFYSNEEKFLTNPSNDIFSCYGFMDFVKNYRKTLKSITFTETKISSEDAVAVSQFENLNLQEVSFEKCLDCIGGVSRFCENQKFLTRINLSGLFEISDATIESLCRSNPFLTVLILTYCKINESIQSVFRLPKLEKLYLNTCTSISVESYNQALNFPVESELSHRNLLEDAVAIPEIDNQDLSFENCLNCTGVTSRFYEIQPFLTHIDLSNCPTIDDATMESLCRFRRNLTVLIMKNCLRINRSIKSIFRLPKLEKLDLDGCKGISSESFNQALNFPVKSELSHLNLTDSDAVVRCMVCQTSKLHYLNLNWCNITDETITLICKLKNLKSLFLSGCIHVTDCRKIGNTANNSRLKTLHGLNNLCNLIELSLRACFLITGDGLLASVKFPYLEHLTLERPIKSELEKEIIKQNPRLKTLITWQGYEVRINDCKK